jgi:hypothetical protein
MLRRTSKAIPVLTKHIQKQHLGRQQSDRETHDRSASQHDVFLRNRKSIGSLPASHALSILQELQEKGAPQGTPFMDHSDRNAYGPTSPARVFQLDDWVPVTSWLKPQARAVLEGSIWVAE